MLVSPFASAYLFFLPVACAFPSENFKLKLPDLKICFREKGREGGKNMICVSELLKLSWLSIFAVVWRM